METSMKTGSAPARSLPEALARMVRHEVGDLLQSVYAAAAILQKRLPPEFDLERRILTDMRARGEACKQLLDAIHDFVCPMHLAPEPIDLAGLAQHLVQVAAARYPKLTVRAEATGPAPVTADRCRMTRLGEILLDNACEAATGSVLFCTIGHPGREAEWTVSDDGPGVPAEQRSRLFTPFFTTRHAHAGLGLALAQKIATLHGGRISAENRPEGGFQVRVVVPSVPPDDHDRETNNWGEAKGRGAS
jgi:signal transduction histidine kinase